MARLLALVFVILGTAAQACPAPDARHLGQHLAAVNAVRAAGGVGALTLDPGLTAQAQAHACDMGQRGYFSHVSPDGQGMEARLRRASLSGTCHGAENIAKGQRSVAAVMDSWMGSPGHRRNLLNPALTHVGFGLAPGQHWVQLFAGRC
jgi:uncharacterized protein YkwD